MGDVVPFDPPGPWEVWRGAPTCGACGHECPASCATHVVRGGEPGKPRVTQCHACKAMAVVFPPSEEMPNVR